MKGTRRKGRPRNRWMNEAKKDLQQMGIWNWRNVTINRVEGRRIVLKAVSHYDL